VILDFSSVMLWSSDLCHGFSEASDCPWRSEFGGMTVPDAIRLTHLEMKNARARPWNQSRAGQV
jgi:hypothetical protein